MPRAPKPNGRITDEHNRKMKEIVNEMWTALDATLGEVDPVKFQAQTREIRQLLRNMEWHINEVEIIHRLAMKRKDT